MSNHIKTGGYYGECATIYSITWVQPSLAQYAYPLYLTIHDVLRYVEI